MTGVSWWGHKVDNAYWMWSFQGRILKRYQVERFCQFLWRPRPPTLLTKKQIQQIKKNLKTKYTPEFDQEDIMSTTKVWLHSICTVLLQEISALNASSSTGLRRTHSEAQRPLPRV